MAAQPSTVRLTLVLLTVQVLFGGLPVAGKFVLPHVPPFAFALCRLAAAAVVLVAIERVVVGSKLPPLRDLGAFAFLALLGVVLNQGLFLTGLQYTTASHAVLLVSTIPAFTLLVASVRRDEKPTPMKLLGLALSFGGVAVLVLSAGLDLAAGSTLGNLLIAANALCYSTYLVLSRPYLGRYDPLTVVAWTFVFGTLEMAAFGVPQLLRMDWATLDAPAWTAFGYALVGATILTYGLNNWALRHAPASKVASFVYFQPLVGVLLAWFVLDEPLGVVTIMAGALILGGVAVANRVAPVRRAPAA